MATDERLLKTALGMCRQFPLTAARDGSVVRVIAHLDAQAEELAYEMNARMELESKLPKPENVIVVEIKWPRKWKHPPRVAVGYNVPEWARSQITVTDITAEFEAMQAPIDMRGVDPETGYLPGEKEQDDV